MISARELSESFEEMDRMEAEKALREKQQREREAANARQQRYAWDHEEAILDQEAERRQYEE